MHPLPAEPGRALPENLPAPHVPGYGHWARYALVPSHVLIMATTGQILDRSSAVSGSMPPGATTDEDDFRSSSATTRAPLPAEVT